MITGSQLTESTINTELLEALRRTVEVLDADGIYYGDCDDEPLDVLRVAREAIERAEGSIV